MRALITTAAAAAIIASSTFAFAAQTANGTVKSFDQKAETLTLADGGTYWLPKGFSNPAVKAGAKVRISFDMSGGKQMASAVTIVK
ncbi:MAG: DUF1344 domain-containing protein [Nitratireductor sp.]